MTINRQLNNTHGYHIKPTNSTCNMISCFCACARSCVAKQNIFQGSQILIIVEKCYQN